MIPQEVFEEHLEENKRIRHCEKLVLEVIDIAPLLKDEKCVLYAFLKWLKRKTDL